jgi:hypothetical protein
VVSYLEFIMVKFIKVIQTTAENVMRNQKKNSNIKLLNRRRKMPCLRCGGKLAPERVLVKGGKIFDGWRCIMCGDVIDEQILENRGLQKGVLRWDTGEIISLDRDLVIGVVQKKH